MRWQQAEPSQAEGLVVFTLLLDFGKSPTRSGASGCKVVWPEQAKGQQGKLRQSCSIPTSGYKGACWSSNFAAAPKMNFAWYRYESFAWLQVGALDAILGSSPDFMCIFGQVT